MSKKLANAFAARGTSLIAGSYVRRLLPAEQQYDAKTGIDCKLKQELKPKSLGEEKGIWTEKVILQVRKD